MRMILTIRTRATRPMLLLTKVGVGAVLAISMLSGCGGKSEGSTSSSTVTAATDESRRGATVVVTHEVLGSIVREVAAEGVDVQVIIPNGKDPHDYEPSARDIALLDAADLVVANGENFEPAFDKVLDRRVADGKAVFFATQHVTVRDSKEQFSDEDDHSEDGTHEDESHSEEEQAHGDRDPHFFTDPLTVRELVTSLATTLTASTGISHEARVGVATTVFNNADAAVRDKFTSLSPGTCKIVTGHDSLGYLADRYGCEVVGVVIPSSSGLAEATAQDFSDLTKAMKSEKVAAMFVDEGTSPRVSDRIAGETGARVVALPSHSVPSSGRYGDYVMAIATAVVGGLSGS